MRPSVVVDDEPDAEMGTGLEATRVMDGAMTLWIDGGRMVETEPPRERPDWLDWEAGRGRGADRTDAGEAGTGIGGVLGCGEGECECEAVEAGLSGDGCFTVDAVLESDEE